MVPISWQCRGRVVCVLGVLLVIASPGCRSEEEAKVQTMEGKVEKIVVNPDGTGEITVVYFSEKHNQEMPGTGIVTKDTEIMINGVVSKLSDIREGERVRGQVRTTKSGGKRIQTALKIHVDRPKPVGAPG